MGIAADRLRHSYEVLREYGNMSSTTIMFVLKRIMDEQNEDAGGEGNLFATAFGPGLTLEAAHMIKEPL